MTGATSCECLTCQTGVMVPMDKWLKVPAHRKIMEEISVALAANQTHVQGEHNEDARRME